jgi:hypothetical protein
MRLFDVRDPDGFIHRIGVDEDGEFHGLNNIELRAATQIAYALARGTLLPPGFTAKEVRT